MADSPLKSSDGVVSFNVLCSGNAIATTVEVVSIEIQHCINRISTATLVINDGDMPNADFPLSAGATFKPGTEIKIQLGYDQTLTDVFSGVIIKHSIKINGNNAARLIIECKDKALAMTVGRKNANYIDKKDSDIMSQLIGNYSGLTASVTATTVQHKELVQFYCSDWDFMLARAEANGMLVTHVWHRHHRFQCRPGCTSSIPNCHQQWLGSRQSCAAARHRRHCQFKYPG
jgi:phage protein D